MRLLFVSRAAFNDVCAEHDRLVKDNARLRAERDQFEKDRDVHKQQAIRAVRELAEARATITRLTGRIDELVRRNTTGSIDTAEARQAIAAWEQRAKEHEAWTPQDDKEREPVEGASHRPVHPALILRRAMDRCAALEARLAVAEGRGRRAAS